MRTVIRKHPQWYPDTCSAEFIHAYWELHKERGGMPVPVPDIERRAAEITVVDAIKLPPLPIFKLPPLPG